MTAIQVRSSIIKILEETPNVEILEIYQQMLINLLRIQQISLATYDADNISE